MGIEQLIVLVLVIFALYYVFKPPYKCPVCGASMMRRNKNCIALITDDYLECSKCGHREDLIK